MRILLIGNDPQRIDLPDDASGWSAECNAALTPHVLDNARYCVFDRGDSVEAQHVDGFLEQCESADVIILPYSTGRWLDTVRALPPRIFALMPHLLSGGAVAISTRRLSSLLPLQDSDPIQDALIRLTAEKSDSRFLFGDSVIEVQANPESLPELVPGMTPGATSRMQQHLARFVPEELAPVASAADAVALVAGLYLMHDCLDRSHALSQDVQGQGRHAAGDYWHAIMHRREPDYGNSKYWYRHVGRHPVFDELASLAAGEFESADNPEARVWEERTCGGGEWDAFAWVDFCEHAGQRRNSSLHRIARRIQWHEMLLLLRQTTEDAYGTL